MGWGGWSMGKKCCPRLPFAPKRATSDTNPVTANALEACCSSGLGLSKFLGAICGANGRTAVAQRAFASSKCFLLFLGHRNHHTTSHHHSTSTYGAAARTNMAVMSVGAPEPDRGQGHGPCVVARRGQAGGGHGGPNDLALRCPGRRTARQISY